MPQISIIVPIYGAETFLHRCLDSIQAQTFNDWECILVDDGSKDRSGAICDEYAEKNSRFRVFHKENGGVSSARNKGIKEAKGEWCCFVDSDDWIEQNYLQNFLIEDDLKYGCVLQGFYVDNMSNNKTTTCILPTGVLENASELVYFLENADNVHNGFLWHRLFSLKIIKENRFFFPEGISFAEDGIFFLNYITKVNNYYITDKVGYHYQIRGGSLTSKGKSLPQDVYYYLMESYIDVIKRIISKDQPKNNIKNGLNCFLWRLFYGWLLKRSMNSKLDYYKHLEFTSKCLKEYGYDNNITCKSKLFKVITNMMYCKPSSLNYLKLRTLMFMYDNDPKLTRALKNRMNRFKTI